MKTTKYRFRLRAFVAPVYRLLQSPIFCFFSFKKREKRISLQRSENNLARCKTLPYLIKIFILISFFSCEKVIDINLEEADKKIVIEGTVPYGFSNEYPEVRISKTKNFKEDNSFTGLGGATVAIQVNDRTVYQLTEVSPGIYKTMQSFGHPNNSYHLTVTLDGNTYTATSTMPSQLVSLDSLWLESFSFGGNTDYTIYPNYKDPAGPGNSYRLIEYQNGVQVKHTFEQNDEISDGLIITRPLINPDGNLKSGDTVRVDLQCIDANVYKYWYSLDISSTGENQSATPTNPITNINGGALGYFSAFSVSSKTIVIP